MVYVFHMGSSPSWDFGEKIVWYVMVATIRTFFCPQFFKVQKLYHNFCGTSNMINKTSSEQKM